MNWKKLGETVRASVHFLDNVIDVNKFPTAEVEKVTKGNRKIGLGVMGFADALIRLRIPYNSNNALKLAEKIMKFIRDEGHKASIDMGNSRGIISEF